MGNLKYLQKNINDALAYYERAENIEPENPTVLLAIARSNHELENYGTVKESYALLKEIDPELADNFAYLELRGDESGSASNTARADGGCSMGRKLIIGLIAVITIFGVFASCSDTLMDEVKEKISQDLQAAAAPVYYSVTYHGNGNSEGSAPTDGNNYEEGQSVTVKSQGTLSLSGATFAGWNTAENGSGTNYIVDSTFLMPASNIDLYAQWNSIPIVDVVFQSAAQSGGSSGISDSTGLNLTFDYDPTTLTAENITVTGATKGALTGSGNIKNIGISNITVANGETVSVDITSPAGYSLSGSPKTAVIYRGPTAVTLESAVQTGGSSGTADSTGLILSFSLDPTTLTADNITVTGAAKGALSGSGTTRSLGISDITLGNGEECTVAITSPVGYSINGSPKTAIVYRENTLSNFNTCSSDRRHIRIC